MADDEYIRLHITPLNPSLLATVLPPSILPHARNISYHEIQTFPERAYGFVELPAMDAEKIKKKLNGTTLKGTKVRIETARPQKEDGVVVPARKKEKGKKRKRDEIPAIEIGERQVKRGWTVPSAKAGKDKVVLKSKYTTGPECLFKTVLPPNATNGVGDTKPTKKKNKKGKEAVIHEFSKTTKYATFLRASSSGGTKKGVAEFVEGTGWVDEDGNVVEVVKESIWKSKGTQKITKATTVDKDEPLNPSVDVVTSSGMVAVSMESVSAPVETTSITNGHTVDVDDVSGDEGDSSQTSSSEEEEEADLRSSASAMAKVDHLKRGYSNPISYPSESEADNKKIMSQQNGDVSGQSSGSSVSDTSTSATSDSSSDSESETEAPPSAEVSRPTSRPQSSAGPPLGLSIKIPDSTIAAPSSTAIHPLEAIYKRTKTGSKVSNQAPEAEESTFSFFGADVEDTEAGNGDATGLQIPLTPFTQRDFEYRGLRSAAPTPDTAFANKRFVWPTEDDEDDEDADTGSPSRNLKAVDSDSKKEGTNANTNGKAGKGQGEAESEFQKWFYEHRGEANRAWKKRRKIAAKDKRQRENRKRQERL